MVDVNRMTHKVQEALQSAGGIATRRSHQGIDVEHLLLALLEQPDGLAPNLLEAAGPAPPPLPRPPTRRPRSTAATSPRSPRRGSSTRSSGATTRSGASSRSSPAAPRTTRC